MCLMSKECTTLEGEKEGRERESLVSEIVETLVSEITGTL